MKYSSLLTVLVTLILTLEVDCNEKKDSIIQTSTPKVSIWEAAFKGNIEAVKKHLEQGVDIGSKDQVFDGTPLHHAAYGGKNEVALFLIKKGADINAIGGPKGFPAIETPLDVATRQSQNQTIGLLRKYGAKTVEELKTKVNASADSLTDNIVGKLITLFLSERIRPQMRFNANGVMLIVGQDGNLEDQGLTYKIKGNDVLIFKNGEREAGLLFSSSNPKRGDQVEMRSGDDKQKLMIIKIADYPKPKYVKAEGIFSEELEFRGDNEIAYYKGSLYTGKSFIVDEFGEQQGSFKNGKDDGLWIGYHSNGKKWYEGTWKDGVEIKVKWWNSKGEIVNSWEESEAK